MTPAQVLARIKKGSLPPALLLLGPEAYERRRLKEAMLAAVPPDAVTQHDLAEQSLTEVVDDARALSLFASERLIWVVNAEAALPKGRVVDDSDEGESAGAASSSSSSSAGEAPLAAYLKNPSPGVTLVFEAMRPYFCEEWGNPSSAYKFGSKLKELMGCFSELAVTGDVVDRAIAIRRERRMKAPDAIIAASALVMNARLATRNTADFKNVKGLHLVDPLKS